MMTTELVTVSPQTAITEAADRLLSQEAGSLVILDDESKISGILTCTDITGLVADNTSTSGATVEEYMTTEVVTISPEKSISDAAVKMITGEIQHLPVTNNEDEMIGMLSTTDLTKYLTLTGSVGTD